MSFNEARKIRSMLLAHERQIAQAVVEMGNIALNHFKKSFRDQGFTDSSLQRWEPRKGEFNSGPGRVRKRSRNTGRAILIQTGALRNSLRKAPKGRFTVRILSNSMADRYASVHNEGLRSGRGSGFTMPKREFVGYSLQMDRRIREMIDRRIHKVWQ